MANFKDFDDYINQTEEFAKPILTFCRECVLEACPTAKEEFKWSTPHFTYNDSILCNMAAFKKHVTFRFWLGAQMEDQHGIIIPTGDTGMGHFEKIKSEEDLPAKAILISYVKEAMRLVDGGVNSASQKGPRKKAKMLEAPQILVDALAKNDVAFKTFNEFSQSKRNDYSEWVSSAKTEKTQLKRLDQTIEWLEEGKSKNWKYEKC